MTRRSKARRQSAARKPVLIAIVLIVLLAGWLWQRQQEPEPVVAGQPAPVASSDNGTLSRPLALPGLERETEIAARESALPAWLPQEARQTMRLIERGGPFPHRQDGGVFGNREGRLPAKPRGYYREYTVDTPGLDHRGARRIVTGGQPPEVYFYTDDHYESFRGFTVTQ